MIVKVTRKNQPVEWSGEMFRRDEELWCKWCCFCSHFSYDNPPEFCHRLNIKIAQRTNMFCNEFNFNDEWSKTR